MCSMSRLALLNLHICLTGTTEEERNKTNPCESIQKYTLQDINSGFVMEYWSKYIRATNKSPEVFAKTKNKYDDLTT